MRAQLLSVTLLILVALPCSATPDERALADIEFFRDVGADLLRAVDTLGDAIVADESHATDDGWAFAHLYRAQSYGYAIMGVALTSSLAVYVDRLGAIEGLPLLEDFSPTGPEDLVEVGESLVVATYENLQKFELSARGTSYADEVHHCRELIGEAIRRRGLKRDE